MNIVGGTSTRDLSLVILDHVITQLSNCDVIHCSAHTTDVWFVDGATGFVIAVLRKV